MTKLDPFEKEILAAYEKGDLKFTPPSKIELVEKRQPSRGKSSANPRRPSEKSAT